jgi:tRNA pseudouridine synthase 10
MEDITPENAEIVKEVENIAEKLSKRVLCDSCLGRLFSRLGHGLDNGTRGRIVRAHFGWTEKENCDVCRGLIKEIPKFSELVTSKLIPYEFNSFLVGSRVEPSVSEAEESLWVELGTQHAEPIKSEINREVGMILEAKLDKPVDFNKPDIVTIIDTAYDNVELQIAPLLIYGRYKKLVRGIPQTRWPCRWCMGKGCEKCGFKGRMYGKSVEEIVAVEVMKYSEGDEHAFHGMGREDIDVRMLGNGRPFVLEVRNPVKRTFDLGAVEDSINKGCEVHVSELRPSSSEEVVELKSAKPVKTYRVLARFKPTAVEEKFKMVVGAFKGREIDQRTPIRVAHRRADKVRKRKILDIEIKRLFDDMAELEVTAEAGTYIKELVHGDEGRTSPSVAEMLDAKSEVLEVDVIRIGEE